MSSTMSGSVMDDPSKQLAQGDPAATLKMQKRINEARSTKDDEIESRNIIQILKDYGQYENDSESRRRGTVIVMIEEIIREWIKDVGRLEKRDEDTINNSGGKIFTFGSYRLGVHSPGTDLDTLCLAPRHIERDKHFFGILAPILSKNPSVSKLTEVRDAFVPLIKMEFENFDIDLLFARVEYKEVGNDLDLLDANILRNCDVESIRSLNGCRVNDTILKEVKERADLENFRTTLRCIKLWAKNRGVYSNVLGYLGGVAWAILVANICIINPYLQPNQLLHYFFRYYTEWEWNSENPIFVTEIKNDRSSVPFYLPEDLFYKKQSTDLMPIITPAFPSQNSTYNVSQSTKKVMLTEIEKGLLITEALLKRDEHGYKVYPNLTWKRVFKKFNFFKAYQHFIQIEILSQTKEDHKKWSGFIEAKLRKFLQQLEKFNELKGDCMDFRPWPESYSFPNEAYPNNDTYYFGIRIKKNESATMMRIDLTETIKIFYKKLKEWVSPDEKLNPLVTAKICDLKINYKRRQDLPDVIRPKEKNGKVDGLLGRRQVREDGDNPEQIENDSRFQEEYEID